MVSAKRCETNELLMPTLVERAWAAGLFDGEGSFSAKGMSMKNAFRPRATMSLTDKRLLCKFVRIVGVGKIAAIPPRQLTHKPAWQWWTSEREFYDVLTVLKPYLSTQKLADAQSAIQCRKDHIERCTVQRPCKLCTRPFRPPYKKSAWKQRYCSAFCYSRRHRVLRMKPAALAAWRAAVSHPIAPALLNVKSHD